MVTMACADVAASIFWRSPVYVQENTIRLTKQWEIGECCAHVFTETWLHHNIPENYCTEWKLLYTECLHQGFLVLKYSKT